MQLFSGFSLLQSWFLKYFLIPYFTTRKIDLHLGDKEPFRIWLLHFVAISTFNLGKIFEKLGICGQIKFVRFAMSLLPQVKEPKLYITDTMFENVPVRIYQPKKTTPGLRKGLLFIHGGSGMFGCKKTYHALCCYLSRESDSVVVFVEYRLGPEHQHPAQLSDALATTLYFMKHAKDYGVDPNHILLGGDSSGGTVVAVACQELIKIGNQPKIRAQILIYPFLQRMDLMLPSHFQNQYGPFLTRKRVISLGLKYLNQECVDKQKLGRNGHVPEELKQKCKKWISADLIPREFKARGYNPPMPAPFSKELYEASQLWNTTLQSPIISEDDIIKQVPETYILTCEYDVIRDDGLLYKKRLEDNGVPVTWNHVKEGIHGFIQFIDSGVFEFSFTKPAAGNIVSFIKGL
ncbi:arylacetamide deacetylase-like 4 [Pantherophis guttatus]|uniref:Arylacetamide deacetylase-like 4 n=1 Tax=Pantherophis guttatus TaxID=94885 RepID=A0A6P9DAI4_PANGU|nr:arylacetamide deacetylase-like 4 [Pantherophis guttatus]